MRMLRRFQQASLLIGPAILASSLASVASAAIGVPGGQVAVSQARQARFAVALPLRNKTELDALLAALQDPSSPRYHKWLTPAQFASRFAPSNASKLAISRELSAAGFTARITSEAVFAHGTQAAAERYFHTRFALRSPDGVSRPVFAPSAPLQLSTLLASQQAHVIGLDGLPEFHTNAVVGAQRSLDPLNYLSAHGPYFAPDLKQAYSYPSYQVATGAGTAIGIISSSPVAPSDIAGYFTYTGEFAPNGAVPQVLEFPIDGGGPYDGTSDITFEATLDVEMSAGSAPGAQIAVFNVPDANDADLFEAYAVAAESGVDIVSSSFGECEKAYDTPPGLWMLEALHNVFAEGSAQGVTFVAASGDNGAFQCGTGTGSSNLGVSAPTDDPFVVAVGGTTSLATTHISGSFDSAYLAETSFSSPFTGHGGSVWGSGGGYSALFGRPLYQNGFVASAFRGVPDLAMHMGGPASGDSADWIRLGGQFTGASGTSAAAPEFAGLLALRVQVLQSRLGDIHSWLYASARTPGTFRTGIPGNNGFYGSTTGLWDPVLGLGTPYGRVIAGKPTAALAGIPYITASNP